MTGARYLALTGGIGGARLARGLAAKLGADELAFVANPGDDFEFHGVRICPDTDTLLYTLAGLHNTELGWGRRDERWTVHETLAELGEDSWFQMGDRDLALSLLRSGRLTAGETLTRVTARLAKSLGVVHPILPPTDDPVRTVVETPDGELAFQDYFVRLRCQPCVRGFRYEGAEQARISDALLQRLEDQALAGILICPSNPYLSIDPILAVPGVRKAMRDAGVPVIAVSPIIGGKAVKGPLAKIMRELERPVSTVSVAEHYRGLIDGFVLDRQDRALAEDVEAIGIRACVTETLMSDEARCVQLADDCLRFAAELTQSN